MMKGIKNMKTYSQLNSEHQKRINDFPLGFAFSPKQFAEMLEKLNCKQEDLLSLGCGGFLRKCDQKAYNELHTGIHKEMKEAMLDDNFLHSAIVYELGNHEYCITGDPEDTLRILGISLNDERVNRIFKNAVKEYCNQAHNY
jgi:hypothetical protein